MTLRARAPRIRVTVRRARERHELRRGTRAWGHGEHGEWAVCRRVLVPRHETLLVESYTRAFVVCGGHGRALGAVWGRPDFRRRSASRTTRARIRGPMSAVGGSSMLNTSIQTSRTRGST